MKTIIESMHEKNDKLKKKLKDRKLFNKIYVWERDPVSDEVDIDKALQVIAAKIPKHFFTEVEGIYIGQFPELTKRNLNALFQDGAIYVSNTIFDTEDFLKNVIHEVAHSIEQTYNELIYDDLDVIQEFIAKRRQLKKILELNGYKTTKQDFDNLNYDQNFDIYLYQDIGYPILHTLTTNLFVSPYAATSFREYLANGFEHYYITDYVGVKSISPKLFLLISKLENLD
jgi:hypothetical protein